MHEFANILEIPEDIFLNMPKITFIGSIQVYIENHRGVIEYTSEKLRVAVTGGEIEILGEDLVLKNILPDELLLEGKIKSMELNQ
ncbi:MAG: sporulation protein YqfC [Clostridia bacterium]|nr:sporulation protein YqfC [Clostridia bacterium]